MEKIAVGLGGRSYDIVIKENIIEDVASQLNSLKLGKNIFVITDDNVAPLYYKSVESSLKKAKYKVAKIQLSPGEHLKSLVNLAKICNEILAAKPDRNSTIIALGGGVIGDLSGFAASMILRGINFIQIPTTLLSQVDSSVGGKTGINSNYGKNLLGSFYQPKIVLIDPIIIKNLPEREFLCGYVEACKYALINNAEFFAYLEKNKSKIKKRDLKLVAEIIKFSCESKAQIVAEDELEKSGARALLNLGHSFGHALENETCYTDKLKHGEAVAIGIVMAAEFSNYMGLCDKKIIAEIESHFKYFNIPTRLSDIEQEWNKENILNNMYGDKKNVGNKLVLILLNNIGDAFLTKNFTKKDITNYIASVVK